MKLLLREWRQQQAQPFQLSGRENAVEHVEEVGDRDQLALRDVAQIGARGQVHRRRKRSQKVFGQVEIDVEAGQVSPVLCLDRVDLLMRKNLAACGMEWMRQRKEALWPQALVTDRVGRHARELFPGHPRWQPDAYPLLQWLPVLHRDALGGMVAEVVALLKQRLMFAFDARFGRHI